MYLMIPCFSLCHTTTVMVVQYSRNEKYHSETMLFMYCFL
jgi:hypothetical protein